MKHLKKISLAVGILIAAGGLLAGIAWGQAGVRDERELDYYQTYFEQDRVGQVPKRGWVTKESSARRLALVYLDELGWPLAKLPNKLEIRHLEGLWILRWVPDEKDHQHKKVTILEIDGRTGAVVRFVQSPDEG